MDISNKSVAMLLVVTIVVALGGTYFTISAINQKISSIGLNPITGFALAPNGTATLTVQTTASIVFTASSVNFGTGNVNTSGGYSNCSLKTVVDDQTKLNIGCESFTAVGHGFTIENDGNTNLSVKLRSNVTALQFIGSPGAAFAWNVSLNESSACYNYTGFENEVYPNTTIACNSDSASSTSCGAIFESVTTGDKIICPRLRYETANDALNIDINVTVPLDAPTGIKLAGLLVTGTTV